MSVFFPTWRETQLSSTASLFSHLSGQRLQPPVDSKGKSESRHFYLLAFIVVTHSPKSGLLVSTFISCLQDLRAIVGTRSAGRSKLSLVQLGFPGLSSALCIFFWHQSWRRHASFLVKVQRERHRSKHTTTFKASAQSWHTWCLAHSTGQSRSVTKSIVKCMGKHTLPTAGMTRLEKEKLIINDCGLP